MHRNFIVSKLKETENVIKPTEGREKEERSKHGRGGAGSPAVLVTGPHVLSSEICDTECGVFTSVGRS